MSKYFAHETAVIDAGAQIGERSKIWHFSHIMTEAILGTDCNLGQNVFVGKGVRIGSGVKIQNNVSVYEGVEIADHVFVGPSAVFTNVNNPRSEIVRRDSYSQTKVGKGATIGANATIVCGNSLGQYCFIGAGSVVTTDVDDFALVAGNPAKPMGWMSRHGHRLEFFDGHAICPQSKEEYTLSNGKVQLK